MSTTDNTEATRKKKVKQLMAELTSGEDKKISSALKGLQVHGDSSVIIPMLKVWQTVKSDAVNKEIHEFLNDLKYTDSADEIMQALKNDEFKSIRQQLLNVVWNCTVDYSEFLADFVAIAVEGDFMETLECLTVIENLDGPFQEHQFLEAQLALSDYASMENREEQKAQLMIEIALIIQNLERNHIEF